MLNLIPGIGLQTAKEILSNTNKSFYEFWETNKKFRNRFRKYKN